MTKHYAERMIPDTGGELHRAYVVKTQRGTELLIDAGIADSLGDEFVRQEIAIAESEGL